MKDAEKVCFHIISLSYLVCFRWFEPVDTSLTVAERVHFRNHVLIADSCPGKSRRMVVVEESLGYLYFCSTLSNPEHVLRRAGIDGTSTKTGECLSKQRYWIFPIHLYEACRYWQIQFDSQSNA